MRAFPPVTGSSSRRLAFSLIVATLTTASAACETRYHLAGNLPATPDDASQRDGQAGADFGAPTDVGTGGAGAGGAGPGAAGASGGTAGTSPIPTPPAPVALAISPREAVTRVARVLWESLPDAPLVAMADSGAIVTDADLRGIARTMLNDPRARAAVGHFYRWWLELDRLPSVAKDPALYPQYNATVADAMAAESEAFGVAVTLDEDGRFGTLLLASHSYLNETLAPLYGISGVTGSALRSVDLDPRWRAGLLTQLAQQTIPSNQQTTSPTRRGMMIRQKLLCEPVAPPAPDDSTPVLPIDSGSKTTRQRVTEATASPACSACHSLMDPLGFAYEVFDAIGRVRLTDSGLPIDATGRFVEPAQPELTFDGPVELAKILATLPAAHLCMGKQWLGYLLGRTLDTAELASADYIYAYFVADKLDLRSLIAAAVTSPAFLAPNGGTPCTPGLDQTCNDSPTVSALYGTCTSAGKCICNVTPPRLMNPATGRCQ